MCKCKITVIFLSVVMLLTMVTGFSVMAAKAGGNLVVNGSFEEAATGTDGNGIVPGWFVYGSQTEALTDAFSYSTEEKISGTKSLKIVGDSAASRGAQFTLGVGEQYKGKTYILSLYVKNVDSSFAYVNFNDSSDVSARLNLPANNTWTQYTHKFTAKESNGLVRFIISQLRAATIYIDAVSLVEVDSDNMIYNGGMEIPVYTNGEATPDVTHQYTTLTAGTFGKAYAFDGDVGMHVSAPSGAPSIAYYLTNTDTTLKGAPFKAGDKVVFSFNMRSNTDYGLKIECRTSAFSGGNVDGYGTLGITGNGICRYSGAGDVWKKQEFGFVLPEECKYISITLYTYANSAGNAYADYDNFDLRIDKTKVTYNNVTAEGARETNVLTPGTVSAHIRVTENTVGNPITISALYKTIGETKQLQAVKTGTITTENRGTKVTTIGDFTIPSENIKDYSLVTYVLNGTELKALMPQAELKPAA